MSKRKKYYVVGGYYTNDAWTKIKEGTREKYGPYSKKKALEVWNSRAWATVDFFSYRFRVYEESELPNEWVEL